MRKRRVISRIAIALMWLVPGTMALGSSCARELRDSMVDAGTGFVADTAVDVLEVLFPVADWLTPASGEESA